MFRRRRGKEPAGEAQGSGEQPDGGGGGGEQQPDGGDGEQPDMWCATAPESLMTPLSKKVFRDHRMGVVTILTAEKNGEMKQPVGSGFVINTEGGGQCQVMTCHHVIKIGLDEKVKNNDSYSGALGTKVPIFVRFFGQFDQPARLVQCDRIRDIAVLTVESMPTNHDVKAFQFGPSRTLVIGDRLVVLGMYNSRNFSALLGVHTAILVDPGSMVGQMVGEIVQRPPTANGGIHENIFTNCLHIGGVSGSPIIHRDKVAGMVTYGDRNCSVGVTSETVLDTIASFH